MLINRVTNTDMTWHQEVTNAAPRVSPIVDLTLDDAALTRAIDNLNFIQMKGKQWMSKLKSMKYLLLITLIDTLVRPNVQNEYYKRLRVNVRSI